MKKSLVYRAASAAMVSLSLACPSGLATCGGGGGGGDGGAGAEKSYTVPWQRMRSGEQPNERLTLYWFPSSDDEFQKSTLRSSRLLALHGSGCMTMAVGDAGTSLADKYASDEKLPVAVLVAADGTVIGKAQSRSGVLEVAQVEQLVESEVKKREDSLNCKLESARSKVKAGDTDGAIDDFKSVLDQKCLFPKLAKQAEKELKKLGVNVSSVPDAPKYDGATQARIEEMIAAGLKAENEARYVQAGRFYTQAHDLDPADPTPLRYLGELYRHQLGDWRRAREIFEEILSMPADPLSRAVALHGLGKMTIHEGQFKKGLHLIEESVDTYPLAMAYRNLAVYWNSEGDPVKANEYTQEALKQDPKDPFNLIFAAVFMAASGHRDQALKVASENINVLPASYNLAAIYAQTGQKDQALELLRRHFFQYERYRSVRQKEMMEARVDAVFASIVKDPRFLALTSDADGRLPMPDKR